MGEFYGQIDDVFKNVVPSGKIEEQEAHMKKTSVTGSEDSQNTLPLQLHQFTFQRLLVSKLPSIHSKMCLVVLSTF